jgi:hypothetical protein
LEAWRRLPWATSNSARLVTGIVGSVDLAGAIIVFKQ